MRSPLRSAALLGVGAMVGASLAVATTASADDVPTALPFTQPWSDVALITVEDDWTDVPGIIGYQGGGLVSATGVDPQTVTTGESGVVDVSANRTDAGTFPSGGVAEYELTDPVVALQGSGTADAPNLVVTLRTTGFVDVTVGYTVRDIDTTTDDAAQPVALQYRAGTAGPFTNVPAAFVADGTQGPSLAGLETAVSAVLPGAAGDRPVVQLRIITTDASGADEWVGIDGLAVTGTPGGGGPAEPVASCPAALTVVEGETGSAPVSATDADSAIAAVAITSAAVPGITVSPTGPGTATLDVAASTAVGTYPVTITFGTDDDPAQTTSCTVTVTVDDVTPISRIQGREAASPLDGDDVIVDAVITSLFTRGDVLDGFFVEEEDGDRDADAATSEGLFVFCRGSCPPTLVAGDLVRLRGEVDEFFEMTQIAATGPGAITVLGQGRPRPTAVPVTLPAAASTRAPATFEAVEGMVVTVSGTLTLTEHFELARFGQVELTSGARPYQFTHANAPSGAGYAAHLAALATRTIILDDDNNDNNDAITGAPDEPYPYPSPGLSVADDMRAGDTIASPTGVLHYSFAGAQGTDAWRLRPLPGEAYLFAETNPRPATVDDVGGRLQVAAFNVLNYFSTIDTTSGDTGPCGPSGTLDCRGADSAAELDRQRAKEVTAIGALDADVVGLIELQNDDGTAVEDLVDGLNARSGAVPYAAIDTGVIGTDAIKVAFIYRPSTVEPVGAFEVLDSTDDPRFIDTRNRPVLIQQFEELATGERFTAAVAHLKSKGSACTPDDPDELDGQGNCNDTREAAAAALADHLAGLVDDGWDRDVVVLGDLNSYRNEDPITTLEGAGYIDLIESFLMDDAYSYLFDGQIGYLDHALANATMASQVTGVTEWHVNADEVPLFDYNDTVRDAGEATFERESVARPLYAADARRASDHDPVVVGLDLASLDVETAVITAKARGGGTVTLSGTTGVGTDACPTLALRVGTTDVELDPTRSIGGTTLCIVVNRRATALFDRATGRVTLGAELGRAFRLTGGVITFVLTVDGTPYQAVLDGTRDGLVWRYP